MIQRAPEVWTLLAGDPSAATQETICSDPATTTKQQLEAEDLADLTIAICSLQAMVSFLEDCRDQELQLGTILLYMSSHSRSSHLPFFLWWEKKY